MLANSVILVLREVLEAAVLISVLLALSRAFGKGLSWAWWPLPVALLGSIWLASSMDTLTDALDGAGQEVTNASIQLLVFAGAVIVVSLGANWSESRWSTMRLVMISVVALALIREGCEIWLYVSGFAVSADLRTAVLTGSAIGAGIGISTGVLLYAVLRALPAAWQRPACLIMLALIGAGMVMQATMLLEQVDWLETGKPVWDSSFIVTENSISGELLYAVFGYEATPSPAQCMLYIASLLTFVGAFHGSRYVRKTLNAS